MLAQVRAQHEASSKEASERLLRSAEELGRLQALLDEKAELSEMLTKESGKRSRAEHAVEDAERKLAKSVEELSSLQSKFEELKRSTDLRHHELLHRKQQLEHQVENLQSQLEDVDRHQVRQQDDAIRTLTVSFSLHIFAFVRNF